MAMRFLSSPTGNTSVKFGDASIDMFSDFLINFNNRNKEKLNNLPKSCGYFKNKKVMECILLISEELRLDPLVGYQAMEILEKFMVKHLEDSFSTHTPQGLAAVSPDNYEDLVFQKLNEKFFLIVFTCVQLASKLSLHSRIVDNNTAVQFLHSMGHSVLKKTLLESELTVLKTLEFRLNAPNPLAYVEILLEVLGHNEPSTPVKSLHDMCHHVLRFVSLQRTAIYDALLRATTRSGSPDSSQREKFRTVTEDYMLLGVGVIAVASYIHSYEQHDQVVDELSHITGISRKSISDFAHVTLMHVTRPGHHCSAN